MTTTEAWERIYETQRSSLVAYAAMLLGSPAAAEDVVQDSFATLLASPHLHLEEPAAYLRTTVVNRCRRELRVSSRWRRLDPDLLRPWVDEAHLDLLDAVGRLTRRRRTAVLLRYYLDLPVNEVAELMNCAPSTVSSLLHRAYKDLKEKLP